MSGLYIHIPFCKSRCIYCGFYSTTLTELQEAYVQAVCKEMEMRNVKKEGRPPISTVYMGGGTPSQLSPALLHKLFHHIQEQYAVADDAEITMECNPDDLSPDFISHLQQLPVNRISMGAQTFSDDRLQFLHRRHCAEQVVNAVTRLRQANIQNISIDLMFGFPQETLADWKEDIRQVLALDVEHISAYSLMYEEGTPLETIRQKNEQKGIKDLRYEPLDEETSLQMYETLIDMLTAAGYEHYEISNFAKRKKGVTYRSRHNSSYWHGVPYIGLGAAAHSYDVNTRSWNISDVKQYISTLNENRSPVEDAEILDLQTRYNDMVTTALRTCEGISLSEVGTKFGTVFRDYLLRNAEKNIARHLLEITGDHIHLTRQGLFISDLVMSDLIWCD